MARQSVHVVGTVPVSGTVTANPASGTIDTVTTVGSITTLPAAPPLSDASATTFPGLTQTSSDALAAPASTRRSLLVQNIGGDDCWITWDGTTPVATTGGFLLPKNGGSTPHWSAPGFVPQGVIKGITAAGLTTELAIDVVDT